MNENDAFYNALIDVAAWDKENTLDRFFMILVFVQN